MVNMLRDVLLLSLHRLTYGLSREDFMKKLPLFLFLSFSGLTQNRDVPLPPDCNMDVCSSFMAAVVTGRYTTSGHLTSLGIRVGVGAGPVKAELFCLGFFHRHRCRWMEVKIGRAVCRVSPHHIPSFRLRCLRGDVKRVKRSHPPSLRSGA